MPYDIRLIKIITGELIIGKFNAETQCLDEVAIIQTVQAQQGVQMFLLPYGYPFETKFNGSIEAKHFLFEYKNPPEDVQNKYLEACSNIALSSKSDSGLIL